MLLLLLLLLFLRKGKLKDGGCWEGTEDVVLVICIKGGEMCSPILFAWYNVFK